jgi:hypothetical protein
MGIFMTTYRNVWNDLATLKREAGYKMLVYLSVHSIYWHTISQLAQVGNVSGASTILILTKLISAGLVNAKTSAGMTYYQISMIGGDMVKKLLP